MNGFAMVAGRRAGPENDGPMSEWLDAMVKKLMTILEAQLQAVEAAGAKGDARGRAADARTLSSLERTLERLARLERERAQVREKKVAEDGKGTGRREALERRLDKRLAAIAEEEPARKPQRRGG
ncbi:MAG TPA: hypothetical protein VFS01_14920 [Rhizomicrobium sp.]|jgi:hypothetical protein|nr:hypothetical protein [Rhizomicrobium sp.]